MIFDPLRMLESNLFSSSSGERGRVKKSLIILLGICVIVAAILWGVSYRRHSHSEEAKKFHQEIAREFQGLNSPYRLGFEDYKAVITYPEHSARVLKFSVKNYGDERPHEVALNLLTRAEIFFEEERDRARIEPKPPGGGELARANRLLEQARIKWKEEDYDSSIRLYEEAIEIKTRLLGKDHPQVVKAKLELTNHKMDIFEDFMSPQGKR